jgi:cyclohexadienyl dehydratase
MRRSFRSDSRAAAARTVAGTVLAALLGTVLAVGLACAGGGPARVAPSSAAETQATLRVGTSGDYPPFSLRADDGHAVAPYGGFDVELAERIAADLGLAVEWVPFRWPELEARLAAGEMDVAMSGVTWRPWRAATGWMTRAVASGGPCVAGDATPDRVAVNRGGVLERFARRRFPDAAIVALDDNRALGAALAAGRADAVVTDSFELSHVGLPAGAPVRCEPPADRKVIWVAPGAAATLGPRLDEWLGAHEAELQGLRSRWLGGPTPRSDVDHLLDLLARRLAYMPSVAAWKRERGLPVEDRAREAALLDAVRADAVAAGLDAEAAAALFALQIELGRRIQAGAGDAAPEGPPLDLGTTIRPELERLGARIVVAAARVAPLEAGALDAADWTPLTAALDAGERARLRAALLALAPAADAAPSLQDVPPSGPSVAERLEEIRRRLQAAVSYPPIARRLALEGTAWLRFEVDRAGAPHGVELARSTGHAVLDRAALRALADAGVLPWVYGRIEVPVRFALDGTGD